MAQKNGAHSEKTPSECRLEAKGEVFKKEKETQGGVQRGPNKTYSAVGSF